MSWLFPSGGQSIRTSASASVLPMNIHHWVPLGLTGLISLQSQGTLKSLLQHDSLKASVLQRSAFFMVQLSNLYMTTGKTIALTIQQFYEDLQDLLELTHKKAVLFIIGDWIAKVGSQEISGVTGKFGLWVQNETGERLTEFCQENALVTANTFFQ